MGDLTPAIQVEKLSFAYEERPILNEISLEIPAGQFHRPARQERQRQIDTHAHSLRFPRL